MKSLRHVIHPCWLAIMLILAGPVHAQDSATIDSTAQFSLARELGSIAPGQDIHFGEVAIPRNITAGTDNCFYFANPKQAPEGDGGKNLQALGCEVLSGAPQMGEMKVGCSASEFFISAATSTSVSGNGAEMALGANLVNGVFVDGVAFEADRVIGQRFKCGEAVLIELNPVLRLSDAAKPTGSVLKVGTVTIEVGFF